MEKFTDEQIEVLAARKALDTPMHPLRLALAQVKDERDSLAAQLEIYEPKGGQHTNGPDWPGMVRRQRDTILEVQSENARLAAENEKLEKAYDDNVDAHRANLETMNTEIQTLSAELAELTPVYYITQEAAFAPGIVKEWPDVISLPGNKNGRLVKKQRSSE